MQQNERHSKPYNAPAELAGESTIPEQQVISNTNNNINNNNNNNNTNNEHPIQGSISRALRALYSL